MINFIFYLIIIVFILSFDNKLSGANLKDNIKNNFSFIKLIGFSLMFSSLLLLIYYILVKSNLIIINYNVKFNFALFSYIFLSAIISPFIEEYIFRYLPYKIFNNSNYKYGIMFLSVIVFTFVHNVNPIEYILVFLSALMLTIIMFKEKNILYSFVSHGLYNLLMICSMLLYNKIGFVYIYLFAFLLIIGISLLIYSNKKVVS